LTLENLPGSPVSPLVTATRCGYGKRARAYDGQRLPGLAVKAYDAFGGGKT